MSKSCQYTRGFTLVELSVVLVVIGLLIGGIIAGKSLIKGSELQAVMADRVKYQAAIDNFKKQYHAIPGDMMDAEEYWGTNVDWGIGGTDGVYNGNGNGMITTYIADVMYSPDEKFQLWKQLVLAKFLTGNYSGIGGPNAGHEVVDGYNSPKSAIKRSVWETGYQAATDPGDTIRYDGIAYGNYLRIGGMRTPLATILADNPILRPEDAQKIDSKMDDAKPQSGTVIAGNWDTCTDSASSTPGASDAYLMTSTVLACTLYFTNQF